MLGELALKVHTSCHPRTLPKPEFVHCSGNLIELVEASESSVSVRSLGHRSQACPSLFLQRACTIFGHRSHHASLSPKWYSTCYLGTRLSAEIAFAACQQSHVYYSSTRMAPTPDIQLFLHMHSLGMSYPILVCCQATGAASKCIHRPERDDQMLVLRAPRLA
ncbi:hypothetical protein BV25DRAFT_1668708 [Artomyces pyxidatus]|uniref:Uncharacterized protein n=1 Tax=Artomyces pyxidatus TaxID=48021 RepID=A0ACB8SHP0_9AGAM|nr:hypothetical protein BV25DRAFT_1668708 [Artomyces pyxidatus]